MMFPCRTAALSLALLAISTLASCGPMGTGRPTESSLKATEDLIIAVYPDPTAEFCRPHTLIYTGVDQPLRRVQASLRMTGPNAAAVTEIPLQAVLTGYDGLEVVREEAISIHNFDVDCAELAIELIDLTCFDDSSQDLDCPTIILDIGEQFKSVTLIP